MPHKLLGMLVKELAGLEQHQKKLEELSLNTFFVDCRIAICENQIKRIRKIRKGKPDGK